MWNQDTTPLFNAVNFDYWRENIGVLSRVTGLAPLWSIDSPPRRIVILNPYNGAMRNFTRETSQRLAFPWLLYVPDFGQVVEPGTEVHIENQ